MRNHRTGIRSKARIRVVEYFLALTCLPFCLASVEVCEVSDPEGGCCICGQVQGGCIESE